MPAQTSHHPIGTLAGKPRAQAEPFWACAIRSPGIWNERLHAALEDCAQRRLRSVILYGAGAHTRACAESLCRPPVRVLGIIDDDAAQHGVALWGFPIVSRETALSMVEFGSVVETRLPYLDNELIDLLLAIPPELKLGDTIQTHILRRHQPAFLQVVNSNTGAPLGAGSSIPSRTNFVAMMC